MVKKIFSAFTAFFMMLCLFPYASFADDVAEHTHDFSGNSYTLGLDVDGVAIQYVEVECAVDGCSYVKYYADFLIFHWSYISPKHLSPDEVWQQVHEWRFKQMGVGSGLTKMDDTNSGANIPAAGGRNPKGYGDEGKANINSNGKEILWVEPFGISNHSASGFSGSPPPNLIAGSSSSGTCYFDSRSQFSRASPVYYFSAPVSGLYYIGSSGAPYDMGSFNSFYDSSWHRFDLIRSSSEINKPYHYSVSLSKGQTQYLIFDFWYQYICGNPYKFYLNKLPIYIEPLGDSGVKNYNKITINNNTWNGNIYVDNSSSLTYIYPQYTTINENNETVTNISNNPIIYNNETYQYYTYDQTTNNYYYITYPNQPTPPPTATPSPTPDPSDVRPTREMYYRWVLTEKRSNDTDSYRAIQASELVFYDEEKNVIKWPSDVSIKSSLSTSWDEPVSNLVDNNTNNKWGCNTWGASAAGKCTIDIYVPDMKVPSYYGYVTGSDAPHRDPVSWELYYSFDGLKYYKASTVEKYSDIPTARNAYTEKWPFYFDYSPIQPTPTPAPTEPPTPTVTPDPGSGGSGSGGSGSGSGSDGDTWNPFKWLLDLLKDIVESILKGLWKLITSIFGFILWLLSLLFKLFPWMPNSGILALCAGVVVVTVIRIIKFITGR